MSIKREEKLAALMKSPAEWTEKFIACTKSSKERKLSEKSLEIGMKNQKIIKHLIVNQNIKKMEKNLFKNKKTCYGL